MVLAQPPDTIVEPGQRQKDLPPHITRYLPSWTTPEWLQAEAWRRVVRQQPVAINARDFIISSVSSLPWRVVARNAEDTEKYGTEIEYYTELFGTQDGGYLNHTELMMQDMLDLPFGGASEVIREGDNPEGRVLSIIRMDGATLFPTFSNEWPVGQIIRELADRPVYFPKHAISRAYYTPRPEILRKGWGMAPPEKIYLAIQLLYRGDSYYGNLLADTPEAGILDLGDMSKDSAQSWLKSWQDLMYGTDPFKVPVLYEHTTATKYIPFGRSPVDLAYERTTLRYAQFVTSNYGVTLADIGVMEGDTGTLAGTIRGERRTQRSGLATARQKVVQYRNVMLPPYLQFELIIQDDELLLATGRARLANATAMKALVDSGIVTKVDAQEQLTKDGLLTVPLEEMEDDPELLEPTEGLDTRLDTFLRPPVDVAQGGEGEITARALTEAFREKATLIEFERLSRMVERQVGDIAVAAKESLGPQGLLEWRTNLTKPASSMVGISGVVVDVQESVFDTLYTELEVASWWKFDPTILKSKVLIPAYENTIKAVGTAIIKRAYVENDKTPIFEVEDVSLQNDQVLEYLASIAADVTQRTNVQIKGMISRQVVLHTLTELSKKHSGEKATLSMAAVYNQLGPIAQTLAIELTTLLRESVVSRMVPDGAVPDELWSGGYDSAS